MRPYIHLFTVEELAVSEPGLADVIKLFTGSLCFLKVRTFLDYLVKFSKSNVNFFIRSCFRIIAFGDLNRKAMERST